VRSAPADGLTGFAAAEAETASFGCPIQKGGARNMVVVIDFVTDVGVLADDEDAEQLALEVIEQELQRARTAILERLFDLGIGASIR
jgi:hypothetical protein